MNTYTGKGLRFIRGVLAVCGIYLLSLPVQADASKLGLTDQEVAWLAERKTLRVMNLSTFPPFSFFDGGPKGYSIDYMNQMGELLGIPIEYVSNKPWHEYLQMLQDGQLDVIPHIAVTEARQAFIEFTPFNHIEYISGVAVNNKSGIKTLQDLKEKGRVVAVTKKTFLHSWLVEHYPDLPLLLTASTEDAVAAVASGKADLVVGNLPALHYYIQRDWLSNVDITRIPDFNLPEKTRLPMGVAKGNHLLSSILTKTNDAISYATASGLREKWKRPDKQRDLTTQERNYLAEKRVLTMCVDPDWMPMEAIEQGKHTGIAADFIERFREILSIPIELVPTRSWAETLQAGFRGQCDFFSMIMSTPERQQQLEFTRPYLNTPLVFATSVDKPYVGDASRMKGKTIGIVKEYAFRDTFEQAFPALRFVEVDNIQDGLNRVRDGEIFAYADSLISVGYWIQNHYNGVLKVSGEFNADWSLGIAVQKENQILKNIFDKAIGQITPGEKQEIINKWISIRYQKGTNWHVTFLSVAAVVLFFSVLLLWYRRVNNKLRHEIELRIAAEESALRLARTDQLTGLLNRNASEGLLDQEMARFRRYSNPVCILIMDVDHFKLINDQYGHRTGDEVLKSFSGHMGSIIRQTDHLIRWGGEEFLVLAPDTEQPDALILAEKLREAAEHYNHPDLPRFSISIGVAQLHNGQNFAQWYEEADKALYAAKQNGRNRVCMAE
ncbi:transporter substrate-binding domain-containing diguanylate cyclase [Oceanospirillum sediminis]|uniref:diguanylate cyclase n=1 Tax=Oceanospirillum sediminis TaxID=2760088 RepID=A0A839IYT1_9GAMM|nr:transporter substrate-binding domain-containing protein [Oceanospirillum sediminis]MBB1489527.1 transporter substrate-binding domain-containing protein [Oceanospirillum sediminis]